MIVEEYFTQFNKQVDDIKLDLNTILNGISEGNVPSENSIEILTEKILKLRCSYDEIYKYGQKHMLKSEELVYGISAPNLIEKIKNSKYRIIKEQLDHAKEVLNKFTRIKSEIEKCAEALKPYQVEAKALLEKIETQDIIECENIITKIKGPECFLQTIDFFKTNKNALFEIMDDIEKYYTNKYIHRGLSQGQYYIDNIIKDNEVLNEFYKNLDGEKLPSDIIDEENLNTKEETILIAINKIKSGKMNASSLKHDLNEIYGISKQIFVSIALFTHLGILSVNQIYKFLIIMDFMSDTEKDKEKMNTALFKMESKGYLAAFMYNGEKIYIFSYGLFECMKKESIKTYIKNKLLNKFNIGTNSIYTVKDINVLMLSNTIKMNDNLFDCYNTFKNNMSKEEFYQLTSSFKLKDDMYELEKPIDKSKIYISNIREDYTKYTKITVADVDDKNKEKIPESIIELPKHNSEEKAEDAFYEKKNTNNNLNDNTNNNLNNNTNVVTNDIIDVISDKESIYEDVIIDCGINDYTNATIEDVVNGKDVPSESFFISIINRTLNNKNIKLQTSISQAIMLAYTASMIDGYNKCRNIFDQLQLATHLFVDDCIHNERNKYTSDNLNEIFADDEIDQSVRLSAYMLAIMFPDREYDYALKDQIQEYFKDFDQYFPNYTSFKKIFNDLMGLYNVWEAFPNGLSPRVIAMLGSNDSRNTYIRELQNKARDFMNLSSAGKEAVFRKMCSECLGEGSAIYECMSIIVNNKKDKEFVQTVIEKYCIGNNQNIDENKIKVELNKAWDNNSDRPSFKFRPKDATSGIRLYEARIEFLKEWMRFVNSDSVIEKNIQKLKVISLKIKANLTELKKDLIWHENHNSNILIYTLDYMDKYLNSAGNVDVFLDLLKTGVFSLNEKFYPIIYAGMTTIRYYEPWRNVLKHIISIKDDRITLVDVEADIFDEKLIGESGIKDNLNQLRRIYEYTDRELEKNISEKNFTKAKDDADQRKIRFKDKLELAYAYGQINENAKELLLGAMEKYESAFYQIQDFACWRRFLEALEKQINDYAVTNRDKLINGVNKRIKDDPKSSMLRKAQDLLNDDKLNLVGVEECINFYDSGQTDIETVHNISSTELDYFSEFNRDDKFLPLFKLCQENSGMQLNNFGVKYLERNWPTGWTNRQKDSSRNLLEGWLKRNMSVDNIRQLFTALGFNINDVTFNPQDKYKIFNVDIIKEARSKSDYRHPISAFGTQVDSPVSVICLYGNHTDKQLVDCVTGMNLGDLSIVLLDNALDLASRRHIGEIFRTQTSMQNSFLLIDQVLLLFLASLQETERIPAMLKCTLPYTTYQPFVRDGGPTADEMFCGRQRELNAILGGASVVYGGRQLGKTALLERAESISNNPSKKEYATYVNIFNCKSEQDVVEKITKSLSCRINDKKLKNIKKIDDLCSFINDRIIEGSIRKMLLLIDEADDFLVSISENKYLQLQPLVDLKRKSKDKFKFVLAGLHNVCRAKNATEGNGIFGQLGTPLCIRPLTLIDARELLSKPLRYLGFQIKERHLEMILTTTNYYPGILQFFGAMLVETLNNDYLKYYRSVDNNPPYTMNDDQLASIINSSDMTKSIHSKFELSLKLDKRYLMLARCIAIRYYSTKHDNNVDNWNGFDVMSILDISKTLEIECLKDESKNSCIILLDEMVDMGILSKSSSDKYRLRKASFVDIIGEDEDKIMDDIMEASEEE